MFNRVIQILSDVRHVCDLKRNLICLSIFNSKGYKDTSEYAVLKISKGALVVMKGKKSLAQLYMLEVSTVIGDATVTTSLSDEEVNKLWHMWLRYTSEHGMAELSRKGLLSNYSTSKLKFYELSVFGKQKRVKFAKGRYNSNVMLDYIHSNLWGLKRLPSKGVHIIC